ncbi:MAG: DUF433 domain-containing protein [Planctomycetes bacterium]|nr:DUF433 domain-containing protein [Planctomycetota bacterium]
MIAVDPRVLRGKPVITGTRVPVRIVVGSLAAGMSVEEVCEEYCLTPPQVCAALSYAGDAAESIAEEPQRSSGAARWRAARCRRNPKGAHCRQWAPATSGRRLCRSSSVLSRAKDALRCIASSSLLACGQTVPLAGERRGVAARVGSEVGA